MVFLFAVNETIRTSCGKLGIKRLYERHDSSIYIYIYVTMYVYVYIYVYDYSLSCLKYNRGVQKYGLVYHGLSFKISPRFLITLYMHVHNTLRCRFTVCRRTKTHLNDHCEFYTPVTNEPATALETASQYARRPLSIARMSRSL